MKHTLLLLIVSLVVAACASTEDATTAAASGSSADVDARIAEIAAHVDAWGDAATLDEATIEAEAAANLVVGPDGPGYGDRNGDGIVSGANDMGLLPALDGSTEGLVIEELGDAACVQRDVLGGSWDDPQQRWTEMTDAIAAWAPSNNTFPSLASHPMRIVGWATLTQAGTLDDAHEYAGHADLHVDVSRRAIADC